MELTAQIILIFSIFEIINQGREDTKRLVMSAGQRPQSLNAKDFPQNINKLSFIVKAPNHNFFFS